MLHIANTFVSIPLHWSFETLMLYSGNSQSSYSITQISLIVLLHSNEILSLY